MARSSRRERMCAVDMAAARFERRPDRGERVFRPNIAVEGVSGRVDRVGVMPLARLDVHLDPAKF
jgi:hypothetical protein